MSPLPRQKRSFLFLPTTWSKIAISLAIFSAGFVIFVVGKKIVSLAQGPVFGTWDQAHVIPAPRIPSATTTQTDSHPEVSTPPVVSLHPASTLEDPSPSAVLPTRLANPQTDIKTMNLHTLASKRHFVYTFEGTATFHHEPCANAIVVVRVTVGDQTQTAGGFTNRDGTYAVSVPIIASANEPIDWVVEAHTPEMKKAESIGRRIATEDTTEDVTLPTSLALLPQ